MGKTLERVLVVEDNQAFGASLTAALARQVKDVRWAASVAEASTLLRDWQPQLALLDVVLPDGTALDVVDLLARGAPAPALVAMSGEAEPEQAFALAQRGVRSYLPKPLSVEALEAALVSAHSAAPDLAPYLRQVVGHTGLKVFEGQVREVMVDEALARADGSRRGAARLLEVSRQLLQHILRNGKR